MKVTEYENASRRPSLFFYSNFKRSAFFVDCTPFLFSFSQSLAECCSALLQPRTSDWQKLAALKLFRCEGQTKCQRSFLVCNREKLRSKNLELTKSIRTLFSSRKNPSVHLHVFVLVRNSSGVFFLRTPAGILASKCRNGMAFSVSSNPSTQTHDTLHYVHCNFSYSLRESQNHSCINF